MTTARRRSSLWSQEIGLAALIIVQAGCAFVFLMDVFGDIQDTGHFSLNINIELFANLGLVAAIVVEARVLWTLLRRQAIADRAISAARGAMAQLMSDQFAAWGLTAAEADVASFTIKGFSIAETAGLRGASDATVKSQLNAIYRKAGVAGRAQLVSVFVEELFSGPLHSDAQTQQVRKTPSQTM
ncbi:helix-turn-helix transcriptional regulator [Thioclava sp.]|uniref:helix-turn-helix transcriptional regulator n=1 Tax=Thioclava sp. TaxID=1933450 RepID=UPI003AA8C04C